MHLSFIIKTSYECCLSEPPISNSMGVQREEVPMSLGSWGRSPLGGFLKENPSRSVGFRQLGMEIGEEMVMFKVKKWGG